MIITHPVKVVWAFSVKQAMEGFDYVSVLATCVTRISVYAIQVIDLALFLNYSLNTMYCGGEPELTAY